MKISKQSKILARKMIARPTSVEFNADCGIYTEFFSLPTEDHRLFSSTRGFGMRVSISYDNMFEDVTLNQLEERLETLREI